MHATRFIRRAVWFALLAGTLLLLLSAACDRRSSQSEQTDLPYRQGAGIDSSASSADRLLPFQGAANLDLRGVAEAAGLSAADFDGDGRLDLAVLSGKSAQLMIVLNGAAGYKLAGEI